jgi:hypothetical protein
MTPQEKAIELLNKFRDFADGTDSETGKYSPNAEKKHAKQCALIAVDAIIEECYMWNGNDNVIWEANRFNYWNGVKQEIENYD